MACEPNRENGEIDLSYHLKDGMKYLLTSTHYADVTLIVEGTPIPAHKNILTARSVYFRGLLGGKYNEGSQKEVELKEIPLEPFKTILGFIYTGCVSLSNLEPDQLIKIIYLADMFGFDQLNGEIVAYVKDILSLDNCFSILEAALQCSLQPLIDECFQLIDPNAAVFLQHENFKTLSEDALRAVLRRDSFYVPEINVFEAVCKWLAINETVHKENVISLIRFPLMSFDELRNVVQPTEILDSDRILDVENQKKKSINLPKLRFRAECCPDENILAAKVNAKVIQGNNPSALLDKRTVYEHKYECTYHLISGGRNGIVVELNEASLINHIKIHLYDRDNNMRSYSYFVEVSTDRKKWEKVIDYTRYNCSSQQYLYFAPLRIRFIRLVGTAASKGKHFHVIALQAMYRMIPPELVGDIIKPTYNVASENLKARVITGDRPQELLNGNTTNYNHNTGFTSHFISSINSIVIQLNQPYQIDSLRLLLWNLEPRSFLFYIQTSTDNRNWQMAVDKRRELVSSWQSFTFSAREVIYIKITGLYNSGGSNTYFQCVHFECPAQG